MSTVLARLHALDEGICRRCNSLDRPGFRRLMLRVSHLGDGPAWTGCLVLLLLVQGLAAIPVVCRLFLLTGLCLVVYKSIKRLSARERPYASTEGIRLLAAPLDRYSFPSGHTLHAVAFSVGFGWVLPWMLVVLVPFALLVALSRITLGLHYPSDVLVGGILGLLLAVATMSFPF